MNVRCMVVFLCLVACGSQQESTRDAGEPDPVAQKPAPTSLPEQRGDMRHPCDRRDIKTIEVDGSTYTFEVPVLCDPTPYIEKGDPPP